MDGGNGDHAPPLLSRLVSGLSSLLGAAYPDQEGDNDSSSRKPVPAVPIDTKWLGAGEEGGQLPQELLVCILSSLSLPSLAAFAATSRAYWRLLTAEGAAAAMDARSLYRALLLREVGDELPLDEFGPEELDWRACLRRWTRGECQWRRLPLEAGCEEPPSRFLHRVAFAPKSRISYCTGGSAGLTGGGGQQLPMAPHDDVWRLQIAGGKRGKAITCHNIYRRGPPLSHSPPARYAASFTLLPTSKKAFLFGGLGGDGAGGGFLDDLWAWEMGDGEGEGGRWVASVTGEEGEEEEEPPVGPCARWGHTVVPYKGRMYLFGGSSPGEAYGDLWEYESSTRRWRELPPYESGDAGGIVTQPPHPRGGHSAAVVGGRYMYIFGGNTLTESFGDCWRLDLEFAAHEHLAKWEPIPPARDSPAPLPAPRIGHLSFAIGPRLYVIGGRDIISGTFHPGAGHVLDTRTRRWAVLSCTVPVIASLADPRRGGWARTGGAFLPHPAGGVAYGGLMQGNLGVAAGFWVLDVVGLLEGEVEEEGVGG